MKEIRTIVEKYKALTSEGIDSVLASVVQIAGSAYRRPGAHMLIGQDGGKAGTISGGCLESDVIEHAQKVFAAGKPLLLEYKVDDEYDKVFGTGSGCNGSVQILLEPIGTDTNLSYINPLEVYYQSLKDNEKKALVTLFSTRDTSDGQKPIAYVGQHALLDELGRWSTEFACDELNAQVLHDARQALSTNKSNSKQYNLQFGRYQALIEIIQSPIKLVVFGAGDDVRPVVSFAKQLDWQVAVVDPRPAFATQERFSSANSVHCLRPEEIKKQIVLDERTAVVLMSHNFQYDLAILEHLRECFSHAFQLKYMGILGPKKRTKEIFAELKNVDTAFWQDNVTSLNFPIGLDIGAETPQEIALSIVTEIQAVFALGGNQTHVEFLKVRQGPIHIPIDTSANIETDTEAKQCLSSKALVQPELVQAELVKKELRPKESLPCPIPKTK